MFQYLVPSLKARRALEGFDVYQVIRGANLGEGFFSSAGFRYVDWVATTIVDERKSQHGPTRQEAHSSRALALANRVIYGRLLRREGRLLRRAAKVCAISRYVRDRIVEAHNLPAGEVEVIPLPVDTEGFTPASGGGFRSGDRFLLCVGRLEDPRKNLGLLLDAFGRVRQRLGGIRLRLVGPLQQKDWLSCELQRYSIVDGVDYMGEVPLGELVRLYQEAEVVLLSSRQEGFGLVLAEAMACETPVVATRCGGPEDVVRDGETGFLVPCDNPAAMANAIEQLLVDDRLRHRMGEAARAHVCQSFSLDVVGAKILDVYRRVYPGLEVE
jgi:glycosyltransferase involved in cell wall biosynthesis